MQRGARLWSRPSCVLAYISIDSDGAHHPSGRVPVSPIGVELFCVAAGARSRQDNLTRSDVKLSQLSTVRLEQIDSRTPIQIRSLREQGGELPAHFRTNFEATYPDPWSGGDAQVLRPGTEALHHRLNGLRQDSENRPAPTGMNSRNGAVPNVCYQNRDAVCCANRKQETRMIRDGSVAFAGHTRSVRLQHRVGMDLAERYDTIILARPGC